MEKERLRRLYAISDAFKNRARKYPASTRTQTLNDFLVASHDNEESFREVTGRTSPDVLEQHFNRCNESGVNFCVCNASKTITVTGEIL